MEELATGYGLVEGPVWDAARQCLYYSDVPNGGVFRLDVDGGVSVQFPHRRGIGGMALHEAGGLVVGGRNLAFKAFAGGPSLVLLDNDVTDHAIGFNDFTTDPRGRIWAGSLAFRVFGGGRAAAGPPAPGRSRRQRAHAFGRGDADQRHGLFAGRNAALPLRCPRGTHPRL